MTSVQSSDDILYDVQGSEHMQKMLARFDQTSPVRTRGGGRSGFLAPAFGAAVMARCSEANLRRYRTILHFEDDFPADDLEYSFLIVPACQILESELQARLLKSARHVVGDLVSALENARDRNRADMLEKWGNQQCPDTIGVSCVVLLALFRALQQNNSEVTSFLKEEFDDDYVDKVRNNRLLPVLDQVRDKFRNPACHGTLTFHAGQYASFVNLLVASLTFSEFHTKTVAPENGLLVAHLLHHTGRYQERMNRSGESTWQQY